MPEHSVDLPLEELPARSFAESLRESLRSAPSDGTTPWRELFGQAVRDAHHRRDLQGLADVAHLAVNLLDGLGRLEEALNEVEHAVVLVREDDEASALLLALKASLLSANGLVDPAWEALARAEVAGAGLRGGFGFRKYQMYRATVQCMLAARHARAAVEEAVGVIQATGTTNELTYLLSWYVPYLYTVGRSAEVHPWERAFRISAQELGHRYRLVDAESFELASRSPGGLVQLERVRDRDGVRNWLAEWRIALLELRSALLAGEESGAALAFERARSVRTTVRASLDPCGGAGACLAAFFDPTHAIASQPPGAVTLVNLGGAVAAAEAVSLASSSAVALHWSRWAEEQLRAGIRTSMEWPASLHRVGGVLAARGGDHRRARRLLQQAVDWCDASDYPVEGHLARLQLAELCAQTGAARTSEWETMRREAWRELRHLDVEPAAHAYAVSNAMVVARGDVYGPHLTPRETQVMELLARGLTYREAAAHLGLKYPTVQTLAHRAYEKLGVSGRHKAVEAARELGVL